MKRIVLVLAVSFMLLLSTACSGMDKTRDSIGSNGIAGLQAVSESPGPVIGSNTPESAENSTTAAQTVVGTTAFETAGSSAVAVTVESTAVRQTIGSTAAALSDRKPPVKTDSNTGVIAKSSNVISNKEREAVLNEIDKELDELFSGINSQENVKDSNLELN